MLDDDSVVMMFLVGWCVILILVKDGGEFMLESMDMVEYIEVMGLLVLIGVDWFEIFDFCD